MAFSSLKAEPQVAKDPIAGSKLLFSHHIHDRYHNATLASLFHVGESFLHCTRYGDIYTFFSVSYVSNFSIIKTPKALSLRLIITISPSFTFLWLGTELL